MADVKTEVDGMKTIEASTRIDLETPQVNLADWAILEGKGDRFVLSNPVTEAVTLDDAPVYVKVLIGGVAHYIAANPVLEE